MIKMENVLFVVRDAIVRRVTFRSVNLVFKNPGTVLLAIYSLNLTMKIYGSYICMMQLSPSFCSKTLLRPCVVFSSNLIHIRVSIVWQILGCNWQRFIMNKLKRSLIYYDYYCWALSRNLQNLLHINIMCSEFSFCANKSSTLIDAVCTRKISSLVNFFLPEVLGVSMVESADMDKPYMVHNMSLNDNWHPKTHIW